MQQNQHQHGCAEDCSENTRQARHKADNAGQSALQTDQADAFQTIGHWKTLQDEINAMSTSLVGLPWQEVDDGIHHALGRLGAFAQAHRAYIFLFRDGNMMDNTHEWCAEGIAPQIDRLKNQEQEDFPWWMERLRRGESIHIPRVSELPDEARAERAILQMQDIESVIVVPLFNGKVLGGFMGFDAVKEARVWPDHVPVLLRVAADIIAGVLDRQRSDRLLHESHARLEQVVEDRTRIAMEEAAHARRASEALQQTVDTLTRTNQALEQTQDELQKSETYARQLVTNSTVAMAVHEIILDADGTPIDYRFLLANAAFEEATGLRVSDIVGRCISEVIPDIGETPFIGLYGEVVMTGQPAVTELYSKPLQRHYAIHAYAMDEHRFATVFQDITKRKAVEQEIEESRNRLETLLDAFPDLMFIVNREGVILDYHAGEPELLAAPPPSFLGHDLDASLPAKVAAGVRTFIERTFLSGKLQIYTYDLSEPRGIAHYEARICPLDDQRVLAVVRDVTEHLQTLAALEASEERFRLAVQASRDVIWEYDINRKQKFWSEAGNTHFGWQADEAHPHDAAWWMEKLHPEDRPYVEGLLSEALTNPVRDSLHADYRFRKHNGDYAHVEDRCHIERDQDGHALRLIGAMHDVTERRQQEMAVARLQAQMNEAQQIAQLGSWGYHHRENRLLWSDETYRIFGIDRSLFSESYEGFLAIIHPDDRPRVEAEFARSLAEPGYAYELDHRLVRRDTGEVRLVHEKCAHERDADGQVLHSYGFVQDITDAVKRNTLSRQSQKLEVMGLLAAGVAHEINNPVSFIMNNFAALETDVIRFRTLLTGYRALCGKAEHVPELAIDAGRIADQEREAKLDFIVDDLDALLAESREGLERIADIVAGMRFFARDDRADNRELWDVNDGVRTTMTIARNEYKYHCHVSADYATDLPAIECMPGKIGQVLLNLLMNATQAVESTRRKEKGRIRIRTFKDADNACIEVSDDGPGIPPAVLDSIFEPFFTTKPLGKGTGLGLAISHDIVVNQHGGSLTVASREGEGATFCVRLPMSGRAEGRD
jgi:PAS domain S-box-containing protein